MTVAASKRKEFERLGLKADRIRAVVNAVEMAKLAAPVLPLRERFSIAPGRLLLLAAGRLSPEKGHRDLRRTLAS